jgi:hypothetical protein
MYQYWPDDSVSKRDRADPQHFTPDGFDDDDGRAQHRYQQSAAA